MTISTKRIRKAVLKLIEEDEEFRLLILAKLGLDKIFQKLDAHDRKFEEILEEIRGIREDTKRIWKEIEGIKEENRKIWKEIQAIKIDIKKIWEEIGRIKEENRKIWKEIQAIKEENKKIWEEIWGIRKENMRIWREIRDIKRFMEGLGFVIEDEAMEVISWVLSRDYGLDVELETLTLPRMEVNIYGVYGDYCVVGEVAIRLGVNLVRELYRKVNKLVKRYPEYVRKNIVPVIYCMRTTPRALEEARRKGIWVLTLKKELTPPPKALTAIKR